MLHRFRSFLFLLPAHHSLPRTPLSQASLGEEHWYRHAEGSLNSLDLHGMASEDFQYDFLCLNESVATSVQPVAKDPEPSHIKDSHPIQSVFHNSMCFCHLWETFLYLSRPSRYTLGEGNLVSLGLSLNTLSSDVISLGDSMYRQYSWQTYEAAFTVKPQTRLRNNAVPDS